MAKVSTLKKILNTLESVARQRASRQKPLTEDEVRLALLSNMGQGAENIRKGGGFTLDPRTGKFVNLGEEYGQMMSPILNQNAVQIPFREDITPEEIMAAIPAEYYPRLQSGAYLGSWVDNNQIYLDPAERYLTKIDALRAGLKSEQKSGANLRYGFDGDNSPFYPVTEEALRQLIKRRAIQAMSGLALSGLAGQGILRMVEPPEWYSYGEGLGYTVSPEYEQYFPPAPKAWKPFVDMRYDIPGMR